MAVINLSSSLGIDSTAEFLKGIAVTGFEQFDNENFSPSIVRFEKNCHLELLLGYFSSSLKDSFLSSSTRRNFAKFRTCMNEVDGELAIAHLQTPP